jgi:predicted GTPase
MFEYIFSGVGKSTFINCLRGLEAEDEGAAKVGVVETTNEPTPYEHPDFSNLKIWDLPGQTFFFASNFLN